MKRTVAKTVFVLIAVASVIGLAPARSEAAPASSPLATELGEFCWQLSPFIDTIKAVVVQSDTDPAVLSIFGRWVATGSYSIALDGSIAADDVEGGYDFQFSGSEYADASLKNDWHFHAKIDPGTLNGKWAFRRNDGFTNNGDFTYLSSGCPAGASPSSATGDNANGR